MTEGPIPGGPGWHIDAGTLLSVLTDEGLFRRACTHDPAVEGLVLLWSGRPAEAEAALRAVGGPLPSLRLRALILDCRRDQGFVEEAVAGYEELVSISAETSREAGMRQHLGKALFCAGRYAEAAEQFARSAELRTLRGDHADLIASSERSLHRVREILGRPVTPILPRNGRFNNPRRAATGSCQT